MFSFILTYKAQGDVMMDTSVINYDLEVLKEEARQLVKKGDIKRNEPIYSLCKFMPSCDWSCLEIELERNDFLLRDKVIDLLSNEKWDDD